MSLLSGDRQMTTETKRTRLNKKMQRNPSSEGYAGESLPASFAQTELELFRQYEHK